LIKKILVVDDNEDMVKTFVALLSRLGYKVASASDGATAIIIAHEQKPDVILLDIGLPGIDGYETARLLRREADWQFLLIAISGYGQREDKAKAHEAGFDHHLTKPVGIGDLEELIKG
jgi:CheY-like chemotaxis protein